MKEQLQHRLFPDDMDTEFDCSESPDKQLVAALRIAERAVNEAISKGATKVRLRYINVFDAASNPNLNVGSVSVVGYRTKLD